MKNALVAAAAFVLAAPGAAAAAVQEPECGDVRNNPPLAIQACTRAIEFGNLERPELAKAYYVRGAEFAAQGNHDRAIADYSTAIELDPKLSGIHYSRALARSEKGDHDGAIADYDAELRLAPKDAKAHIGRAVEWTFKGDYKRAVADYEQALRLEDKSMQPIFGRGRARFYAGDFLGAASDFVRAHQLEPSTYTALWLYLARKYADIPGEQTLAAEAGTSGEGEWPAPVVALYLGRSSPEAVQQAAAHADPRRQRDRRCEASFYIAHWHLLRKARDAALRLLDEARAGCPSGFLEHEGAIAELRRLKP